MTTGADTTVSGWAMTYLSKGLSPTPVAFKGKNPILAEWQTQRLTEADVTFHFNDLPRNIGVLLGEPSNGLVDIDIDCPGALLLAPYFLGETGWRFGRASNPNSHWLYLAEPPGRTTKFADPDGAMLVEYRSTGAQTVFPGSVHTSGEPVEWVDFHSPTMIDGQVLKTNVSRLAAAALLARNWPQPGSRQGAALALSGGLLRAGWEAGEAKRFITGVVTAAGDEEPEKRISTVDYTIKKQGSDEPTTGWRKLGEFVGQPIVQKIRQWLETKSTTNDKTVTDPTSEWEPMTPLPSVAPAVPTLEPELIPEPIRPWLSDIAIRACIPLELVAAPWVVGLSSVIGRTIGMYPRKFDDWVVVPNLWGADIARSGMLKSHIVNVALNPVNRLAAAAREKFEQDQIENEAAADIIQAEIDVLKSQMKTAAKQESGQLDNLRRSMVVKRTELLGITPTEKRYLTQDATVEKLAELLKDNPRGMLVVRDEVAGWLSGLDKPGREGDREFYLEAWNGTGNFTVDRIGRGTVYVPALTLSIFGGIQPGKIRNYILESITDGKGADGLLQRFQIMVWPDGIGKWNAPQRWPDNEAKRKAFRIFEWLDDLDPTVLAAEFDDEQIPALRFTPDAQEFFDAWYDKLENRLRSDDLADAPAFESHMAKYRSLMPSLALLFHLVDVAAQAVEGTDEDIDLTGTGNGTFGTDLLGPPSKNTEWLAVSLSATRRASDWCVFLEAHARKAYATELYPGVQSAHLLKEKIEIGEVVDNQSLREIYRHHWTGLKNPAQVKNALGILEQAGWVRVDDVQTDGRPGQVLRLHPKLRDGGSADNC